ncbi:hypothetical protein BJX68DRAFT_245629 [Aspergillus pseudodeflectus]|uniref:DUF7730 domain-containing protein n=1 Tax=Aspergillus pseudodeflectus TaxID=176178 RepID=A0ABR4JQP4_9EURO
MAAKKDTTAEKVVNHVKEVVLFAGIIICCPFLCCYFCVNPPRFCGYKNRSHYETVPSLVPPGWSWRSEPPEPLPRYRRSLSAPPSGLRAVYPGLKPQKKSRLFTQLAPEIRLRIYEEVLAPEGNEVLHLASTHRRVFGIRCSNTDKRNIRGWQHACWPNMIAYQDGTVQREPKQGGRLPGTITGLLRSCRQVYSEAIGLLYTKNILQVRQARTLGEFPLVMRHDRLATVRKLHLDMRLSSYSDQCQWTVGGWNDALHVVRYYMQGLQQLRVSFGVKHDEVVVDDQMLVELLQNLSYVEHVPDFVVEFRWRRKVDGLLNQVGRPPDGFPFRVDVYDILDQPRHSW